MKKKRTKRTLREKASQIGYRVPKNYVDDVVEACIAAKRDPNELGQVGLMLLVNHKFFDFDNRLSEIEDALKGCEKGLNRIFRLAGGDDE